MAQTKRKMTEFDARMIFKLAGIDFDNIGWYGIAQRITSATFKKAEKYKSLRDELGDHYQQMAEEMSKLLPEYHEHMTAAEFVEFFDKHRRFDIYGWIGVVRCIYLYYAFLSESADDLLVHDRRNIYSHTCDKLYYLIGLFDDE